MNKVVIISDNNGNIVKNLLKDYNNYVQDDILLEVYSFVQEEQRLKKILEKAYQDKAIIVYTIKNNHNVDLIKLFCTNYNLKYFDIFEKYSEIIGGNLNFVTYEKRLDEDYFNRIECIEFAIANDDGRSFRNLHLADVIILGVSRTGKTPLSMYLALQGYKVVNIPLFENVVIPKELYQVNRRRIFGLTNSVKNLLSIRSHRISNYNINYTSKDLIKKELNFAFNFYDKIGCDIINTEEQAIEEIANYIENVIKEI